MNKPDAQGRCHSYYGTWNINDKPRLGVVYFMLDEHVKKMIDKEKDKFEKQILIIIDKFNLSFKQTIKKQAEEIKIVRSLICDLTKLLYKTIDLNKLIEPPVEKVAKKKPKPKIEDEYNEDDLDNGYL